MSAEEGLYGCWFAGRVQRVAGGWALVQYEELREGEEEGSPHLREWFPVPGQRQAAGGPLAGERGGGADGGGGHTVHSQWETHQLRPTPPADVGRCSLRTCAWLAVQAGHCCLLAAPLSQTLPCCCRLLAQLVCQGQARAAGDTCEAYINDGWWQGSRVLALKVPSGRGCRKLCRLPAWVAACPPAQLPLHCLL